ncbi:MAG TPA: nuclear transport factor 2 family protein [Mycobacterium sp.]|jgi:ketosteroid isomerase-like protein|nr:nuclear transport factor 2 family protein [Mycobacterium sp.]
MTDEAAIRGQITRWVEAIQAQDLEGVLAEHDPNIVQFDVPPPYNGVRGIDAYRDTWPPFFEWISQGAQVELLELDVVAGADVAFAYGLLRCGTAADFAANPDNRLRMTVGLRKIDGRWVVAHEHHSFPLTG